MDIEQIVDELLEKKIRDFMEGVGQDIYMMARGPDSMLASYVDEAIRKKMEDRKPEIMAELEKFLDGAVPTLNSGNWGLEVKWRKGE